MTVTPKIYKLVFIACMVLMMVLAMSFFMTWLNIGFTEDFPIRWLKSFGFGYLVAYPIAIAAMALTDKFLPKILKVNGEK